MIFINLLTVNLLASELFDIEIESFDIKLRIKNMICLEFLIH